MQFAQHHRNISLWLHRLQGALPLPRLPRTSNPDEYASAVAAVVFGLDTRLAWPGDYRALLMAEADRESLKSAKPPKPSRKG